MRECMNLQITLAVSFLHGDRIATRLRNIESYSESLVRKEHILVFIEMEL